MTEYDIVLNFEWIHNSHIHKYLAFSKSLNRFCKCLLVINNGKLGITEEYKRQFKDEDVKGVIFCGMDAAAKLLEKLKYKIYVSSSAGSKSNRYWVNVAGKKSTTVIISDFMGDAGYCRLFNIYSLINPIMIKTVGYRPTNIWFSNCLLWDNISDCLPYSLTKTEFCDKYSLDPKKDIFLWMPDGIQCQKGLAIEVYKKVCSLDNVIIKLHPNEYSRNKADMVNNKWSYDLYADKKVTVLNTIDTHWAYTYADCGFSHTSAVGLEFPIYKKPFVYVDHPSLGGNKDLPYDTWVRLNKEHFGGEFSWVGGSCSCSDLHNFVNEKKYVVPYNLYNEHMKKFLAFPEKRAIDVLTEQLIGLLGKK